MDIINRLESYMQPKARLFQHIKKEAEARGCKVTRLDKPKKISYVGDPVFNIEKNSKVKFFQITNAGIRKDIEHEDKIGVGLHKDAIEYFTDHSDDSFCIVVDILEEPCTNVLIPYIETEDRLHGTMFWWTRDFGRYEGAFNTDDEQKFIAEVLKLFDKK